MKKILVFFALLCFAVTLSAQVVYIRGDKLMLRYGSENYSVELKGDSIEINGTGFIKYARLFGGDSLLIGDDTLTMGGFYVTDTAGVTTYKILGDTIAAVGGGGSIVDTGYVKTTGDSMYSNYTSFNGSWLWTGTTGATPASGAGTRMMWIPEKGAFRAGYVDDFQWDDAYIGDYSAAFGQGSYAIGESSFSVGDGSIATGSRSFAICGGTANNDNSFSMGGGSYGDYSFTAGSAITNSYFSFAIGRFIDTLSGASRTTWVSTDPLFDIGNGASVGNENNAFRILKNGKTYIGDMSSTTDPILTVDPTDSTSTFIGEVIIGTLTTSDITITDTITLADALADSVVTDTLRAGRIYVDDITHMFGFFGDSSVVFSYAASGTWYHLSNATDSLWQYVEKDGFTVSNDTIIMTESGDYQFVFSLSAEGGNGETYKYRFFNVTDNVGVPVGMAMTGRGAGNIGNVTVNAYCHSCSAGDRFVIQTQSDGTTSTELKSSSIIIKKLHE